MAVDERDRLRLRERLVEVLGRGPADTLMASLPAVEWSHLATRQDLADLATELRSEMAVLGSELRSEMAVLGSELRSEVAGLRADVAVLGSDLRTEMSDGRSELISSILTQQSANLRVMVAAMLVTVLTTVAIVLGAVGLSG